MALILAVVFLIVISQTAEAKWVNRYCWDSYTNQTYVCGGFDDGIYPYTPWPYYPPYSYYSPYWYGYGGFYYPSHRHHHFRHHRR